MANDIFRTAYVYVRNTFAGVLNETDEGYSFKYNGEYAANTTNAPISLILPLRKAEYTSKWLFPFFDGLEAFYVSKKGVKMGCFYAKTARNRSF